MASDPPAARPLRILVADDNEDGREMLAYLLTAEGHTVAQAADGLAAVDIAATFRPDVAQRRRDSIVTSRTSRHQRAQGVFHGNR